MSIAHVYQTDNARFQISNGSGKYVTAAAALADPSLVVGKGLYIDLFRDHDWRHIARVEQQGEQIAFIFLDTTQSPSPDNKREGNVTTEITLTKVVEKTELFDAGDEILVSCDEKARPKNRKHGKITTFVNEELPD